MVVSRFTRGLLGVGRRAQGHVRLLPSASAAWLENADVQDVPEPSHGLGFLRLEDVLADRYADLGACQAIVSSDVREHGYAVLPHFLKESVLDAFLHHVHAALPKRATSGQVFTNPYYDHGDPSLPACHPKNLMLSKRNSYILKSQLPRHTNPLEVLQTSPEFHRFLRFVTGTETLTAYGSIESAQVVAVSEPGDHQDWHFDHNLVTVTFMLQPASQGGILEVFPKLRGHRCENFAGVAKAISGELEHECQRVVIAKGTAVVFLGRHSLHRVTKSLGPQWRLQGILSFDDAAGRVPDEKHLEDVYGKAVL